MIARPIWTDRMASSWRKAPIVWLAGPRRTGKTVIGQSLAEAEFLNCDLPSVAERLRDPESRRWHALRIAAALGVSVADLAGMLGTNEHAIRQTPDGTDLQGRLAPFANILAMAQDYYLGDENRTREWLIQPQARLGGRSPLDALRIPGRAPVIEQWIAGIWLGDGE